MPSEYVCWRCGIPIGDVPLPLSRLAECTGCHADLHVCKMCRFYDPSTAQACREPVADEVRDKEHANFCGYFEPAAGAYSSEPSASHAARAELNRLFGEPHTEATNEQLAVDKLREELDKLFKG